VATLCEKAAKDEAPQVGQGWATRRDRSRGVPHSSFAWVGIWLRYCVGPSTQLNGTSFAWRAEGVEGSFLDRNVESRAVVRKARDATVHLPFPL
jgi:hypothetical protein